MTIVKPVADADSRPPSVDRRDFGLRQSWLRELERARGDFLGRFSSPGERAPETPRERAPEALSGTSAPQAASNASSAAPAARAISMGAQPSAQGHAKSDTGGTPVAEGSARAFPATDSDRIADPMARLGPLANDDAPSATTPAFEESPRPPVRGTEHSMPQAGVRSEIARGETSLDDAHVEAASGAVPAMPPSQNPIVAPGTATEAPGATAAFPLASPSPAASHSSALPPAASWGEAAIAAAGRSARASQAAMRPVPPSVATAATSPQAPLTITATPAAPQASRARTAATVQEAASRDAPESAPHAGERASKRKIHVHAQADSASVWIRDAQLGAGQAPGLLARLAAELAAAGRRLRSFTLNGRTVFDASPAREDERAAPDDNDIQRQRR